MCEAVAIPVRTSFGWPSGRSRPRTFLEIAHVTSVRADAYRNSRNSVVGDLYHKGQRVFACSEPATLAAALYAMQSNAFTFTSPHGKADSGFPLEDEFESLAMMLGDREEWGFMMGDALGSDWALFSAKGGLPASGPTFGARAASRVNFR